ncbi:MAG: carboxylating nicotinate-nucleotide diphosphorylase [Lautropia sp.]|nr:carboxylating nicotinate-nucleotide diphosphorylase [Lautropia sp.]
MNDPIRSPGLSAHGEAVPDAPLFPLPDAVLMPFVTQALAEDLGRRGDVTSAAVIPPGSQARLAMVSRSAGVLAGLDLARLSFHAMDPSIRFVAESRDGEAIEAGQVLARVEGDAIALLSAERTALNFMTHLSGIAGMTAAAVALVAGTGARITCSRKTLPGLRVLQKYAVRAGGGWNHRLGLDDAMLIKDNHLVYAESLGDAVRRARAAGGYLIPVEVEVDTLAQLDEVLAAGADWVLLDNMDDETLREAVRRCRGRARTEASGGITPERLKRVAACGVDSIALGYLTHSSRAHDIGLDYLP